MKLPQNVKYIIVKAKMQQKKSVPQIIINCFVCFRIFPETKTKIYGCKRPIDFSGFTQLQVVVVDYWIIEIFVYLENFTFFMVIFFSIFILVAGI